MVFVRCSPHGSLHKILLEHDESREFLSSRQDFVDEGRTLEVPLDLLQSVAGKRRKSDPTTMLLQLLRMSDGVGVCATPIHGTVAERNQFRGRIKAIEEVMSTRAYNEMIGEVRTGKLEPRGSEKLGFRAAETSGADEKSHTFREAMKDMSIGLDMRLMSLAGAVVGYYVPYARGSPKEHSIIGAAVGAVVMLLVDAVLLMIYISRSDSRRHAKGSRK